ncbi:MAG TPA: hypothetical protein DHW39_01270 [Erysipelotrichaceae bacterium]|nr:hypothetical protein [Erysipelotrichaceae bacterium]
MKINFWYVRHGKTLFNTISRMQGQCDSPLTEEGISQAEDTASALCNVHFDSIYCSSSERAVDTALIMARGRNIDPVPMKGLKEFDFGELDGHLIEEMKDRIQPHRMADDWTDVGGENVELFEQRITPAFNEIIQSSKDGDNVLIVSHGSFFMHLMKTILHYDQQEYIRRMFAQDRPFVPNCSISRFTYEDGVYTLTQEPMTADEFRGHKTVRFCYVRHGETIFNRRQLMQGWCDSPLTENGIAQAEEAAELLRNVHFNAAYCSSLERTRDTAAILLKHHGIQAVPDKRLREVFFGTMEAAEYRKHWDELIPYFMKEDWTAFGGENHEMIEKRQKSFLRDVIDQADDNDMILLVSHGDFYVSLMTTLFGKDKQAFYEEAERGGYNPTPNCGIAVFEYRDGTYYMIRHMHETDIVIQ